MEASQTDLSVFNKLNLDKPPVGVKFLFHKPEGIAPLGKQLALCEMLGEAQSGRAFYMTRDDEYCFGKSALGMVDGSGPITTSGELGMKFELFEDARASKRLVAQNPGLAVGSVNYVAFAPLGKLDFDPDLLVIQAQARQAELVLRATTYSTGDLYESRCSTALSCGWLFAYPYLSGKVNYFMTGLGFGAIGRRAFEPGWLLISIPYNWIGTVARNLARMKWELPAYQVPKEDFQGWVMNILGELAQELKEP